MKTKHSKEYYVLVGFTILIPIVILLFSWYAPIIVMDCIFGQSPDIADETIINESYVSFVITDKYTDGYNKTKVWVEGEGGFYILNKTLFEELKFNKKYTCDFTDDKKILDRNRILRNCSQIIR